MKLYSFAFDEGKPHEVFTALADQPYSLFFDSADAAHELSRYSYALFHPLETIESKNGTITVTNSEQQFTFEEDPFVVLRERTEDYGIDFSGRHDLPPFQGGAAGFFGYDLARGIENLPLSTSQNEDMPDMAVGIYDSIYAYDHNKGSGWFVTRAANDQDAEARFQHFIKLSKAERTPSPLCEGDSQWNASHSKHEYKNSVQKVIDYIHAGDIFQANLSQRFEAVLPEGFDSWEHYLVLREVNAAPYASYMNFGSFKLASASPELFLTVSERAVETRPIKGTIARDSSEAVDQLYRNSLENSDKDRAENTMIVDLLRNDLSKVCEDHSIDVPKLCKLESFARVHHLVSTVTGTLRADQKPADLLKACFPGGSITGAPKVRAMEIIEELEKQSRGPYCGAMGYIGFDGHMSTNITIRTLVYEQNKVSFNVGGGIVADSKPEIEYEETMTKAEALFASFDEYIKRQTSYAPEEVQETA